MPLPKFTCPAAVLALLAAACAPACAQLRIVNMNTANSDPDSTGPRTGMNLILSAINSSISDDPNMPGNTGIAKPIDILTIQESAGWATTGLAYASLLNSLVPGANYQVAHLDGASTGTGTQSLIYNANTVSLIGTAAIGTASTTGQPRQTTRFELRPVGYDSSADFYIYDSHMKADSDTTSQGRRLTEATAIRADSDALPANSNIIYTGDYNVYRSTETAFQKMLSAGPAQAIDPINQLGSWTGNQTFQNVDTQSPFNSATAKSLNTGFTGSGGGMDDRFDFQLLTSNMLDGQGLAYIPNSYQAFGNNGSMAWGGGNNDINQGGNTAQPQNILDAMASILDHLPVVADYQLPARLSVSLSAAPAKVITSSSASITASVTNSAPVLFSNGADTLAYTLTATGSLSGSGAGSLLALTPAATHSLTLSTSTPGPQSGTISASSTSQQVANGSFSQSLSYTVVDHSNASLSPSSDINSQTLDFGYVPQGFASRTANFSISNLQSPSGYTADLALTSTSTTGSPELSTNVTPFTNLPANSSNSYSATLDTTTAGALSTTQTYSVSDEAIPGSAPNTPLAVTITAQILSSATFPSTGFLQLNSSETYNTGPFSIATGVTLTKTGPGALNITGPQSNGANSSLILSAGSTTLSSDAGSPTSSPLSLSTSNSSLTLSSTQHLATLSLGDHSTTITTSPLVAQSFSITPTATLDLTTTSALLGAFPSTIRAALFAGQIFSSSADSTHTLAYAPSDPTSTLLKYTLIGDANLDGTLNADDYTLIDKGFAQSGSLWTQGDFNYDGIVDQNDYLLIDRAFYQAQGFSPGFLAQRESQFGDAYIQQLLTSIPEPSFLLTSFCMASLTLSRRRQLNLT
jgi:hypothetical protein